MSSAYPLAWPPGWPRTKVRERGPYRTELATALKNLRKELGLLAGQRAATSLVLSSNVTLGAESPADPGVVAYFLRDEQQVAIPCDRWNNVAHNVQAIALTIESMRAIERHGAKHMVTAMFQGFTALPAPAKGWRAVLGMPPEAGLDAAEVAYRTLARGSHPDTGGSHERMAELNTAIAAARKELWA